MLKQIKIDGDKVVTRPYYFLFRIGVILSGIYMALLLFASGGDILFLLKGTLFSLSIPIFLCLLGLRTRTIDFDKQIITYYTFFVKRTELPFSSLDSVKGINGGESYKAFKVADKYGKGLALSGFGASSSLFATTVMPRFDAYFGQGKVIQPVSQAGLGDTVDIAAEQGNSSKYNITKYTFFTKDGDRFRHEAGKPINRKVAIGLLALGIVFLLVTIIFDVKIWGTPLLVYISLPLIVIGGALLCNNKDYYFDTSRNAFVVSSAKKEILYPFDRFDNFIVTRNTINGMYSGTDIYIKFKTDNEQNEFLLVPKIDKNKIDRLFEETLSIIKM